MMRVLIIEDDESTATYIQKGLQEVGHMADIAVNGDAGLSMASNENYQALIVDRMLPRMDGLTVISTLRAQKNHTPVLILSALGDVDDRVEGLKAGGDDYLTKPFAFSELLARLDALSRRTMMEVQETNQVVTRTMLLENVWDYNFDPQTNVIDVHISRLRSKIDKNFDSPLLDTVRGAGYILRATKT